MTLNPKSLSHTSFFSKPSSQNSQWCCVLTTIDKSPLNLPVAMPTEWLNWWHLLEHALCGWWNATIVHTLCTSGVKGGFSRFMEGRVKLFFVFLMGVGIVLSLPLNNMYKNPWSIVWVCVWVCVDVWQLNCCLLEISEFFFPSRSICYKICI